MKLWARGGDWWAAFPCGVKSSPDLGLSFPTTLPIASRTSSVIARGISRGRKSIFYHAAAPSTG